MTGFVYEQATGKLFRRSPGLALELVAQGYSGRSIGLNAPDAQHVPGVGPIPRGDYRIDEPRRHVRLGPLALPLVPVLQGLMGGRSGFYIHGDNRHANRSASSGCIILERSVRALIARSRPATLTVVARVSAG